MGRAIECPAARHVNLVAVPARLNQFAVPAITAVKGFHDLLQRFGKFRAQQLMGDCTERLLARKTVQLLRAPVPIGDSSLCIAHQDCVKRQVQKAGLFGEVALVFLSFREHAIKGIGKHADFIVCQFGCANRVIPPSRNALRRIGQREDGLRNAPLQERREDEGANQGAAKDSHGDNAVAPHLFIETAERRSQIQCTDQSLLFDDGLEKNHRAIGELIPAVC